MKVTMLEAREAALDGVNFVELEEGEIYDVPEFLAASYCKRGIAKKASDDAPAAIADPVPDPDAQNEPGAEWREPDEAGDGAGEPPATDPSDGQPAAADKEPPSEEGPSLAELEALSRDALNKLAKKAGIEGANKLPNKKAVAEAIIAARGE